MHLNERAWKAKVDDVYAVNKALKEFLSVYMTLNGEYHVSSIFVPENMDIQFGDGSYPVGKWMAEADPDDQRRFWTFWTKRQTYPVDGECEFIYKDKPMCAGTQAALNDSFVLSLGVTEVWRQGEFHGMFYDLLQDVSEPTVIRNVFCEDQLHLSDIKNILEGFCKIECETYDELWERRRDWFPYLEFCPSVKKDIDKLERTYLKQIFSKLLELNQYCKVNSGRPFDKNQLSKTTPESESTMNQYASEHTFFDEKGNTYLASWHLRFTGIAGRIFFVPDYDDNHILVCYIGEKLPNVSYH